MAANRSTPMSGRFHLDTNAVISVFGNDAALHTRLSSAAEVFISSVVLGELYYGAQKSSRVTENLQKINDLAAKSAILGCELATAQWYGEIKNSLRAKGRPIPENDIWIAAIAKQYDLTVFTRDAHFAEVECLAIDSW
jgi:tRNA(fMet)-specific endonuclease VapC